MFAPALLMMYHILKRYTYPAVEDPFFKDSTLFTLFAIGLIEGFFISAFYVRFQMSNMIVGVLFAIVQQMLILVVLNLKRFHRKSDTVFYGFSLGLGQGVGMAFGVTVALLSVYDGLADVDVFTVAIIVMFIVQELMLMCSTGATIGEGVARLNLMQYTTQAVMVGMMSMILWTFAVMGSGSWWWIPMSIAMLGVSAYYFYHEIHKGLSSIVAEVVRIEGGRRRDIPR